jgi:hypothetical protein
MELINWDLAREPYNWLVVILMLLIAIMALTYLQAPLGQIRTATLQVI